MDKRTFLIASALIVLAAFGLREWFVLTMVVPEPNQGDVGAYLRYALNLPTVFSQSQDGTPDAFRSPGYPALLAILLPDAATWADGRWFARIYQVQAVLGALTVAAVIALARTWLSRPWALVAGVWMALQAHHLAATGAILTEVLYGFLVVVALLAAAYGRGLWAGVSFGAAYLTNPVIAFLPFLLRLERRQWLAMAGVMVLCIGGWSARNALVDAQGGRAGMNFVQGSWRTYHRAARWPNLNADTMRMIAEETALLDRDPKAGLTNIYDRLSQTPNSSLHWYIAEKPFVLWDWDVRIGMGQHYVIDQRNTITHSGPMLLAVVAQWKLNTLAFCLACIGLVLGLFRGGPERMVAMAVLYVTAVHVVLQAEPRYAIPYRGLEILLVLSACQYLYALAQATMASIEARIDAVSAL